MILGAYEEDIKYRLYSTQPANNQGWRVNPHEIEKEGVVYEDSNVKVEAFPAPHGSWPNAWSYRFTTPDKTIVISGDTGPSEKLMEYSRGVDILVHGVYSGERVDLIPESWKIYMSQNHTSTYKLAEIATKAQPKVLVLYHTLPLGTTDGSLLEEIQSKYSGRVHLANDLDIF